MYNENMEHAEHNSYQRICVNMRCNAALCVVLFCGALLHRQHQLCHKSGEDRHGLENQREPANKQSMQRKQNAKIEIPRDLNLA